MLCTWWIHIIWDYLKVDIYSALHGFTYVIGGSKCVSVVGIFLFVGLLVGKAPDYQRDALEVINKRTKRDVIREVDGDCDIHYCKTNDNDVVVTVENKKKNNTIATGCFKGFKRKMRQ